MIEWSDELAKLSIKGYSKGNLEGLLELLEREWKQAQNQEKLASEALSFGKKFNLEIVKLLHGLFGRHLSFTTIISPEWTLEKRTSRFSSHEKKYFTRFFIRSQIKIKVSPLKKLKFLIKWNEKLKDPETPPENHQMNPTTTGHLKIQLVEKHEKTNMILLPPMKQYEVAEDFKEKIDSSLVDEAIKLKVQFSQKKERDKLVINLELTRLQTDQLEQILKNLFRKMKDQLFE
jgi:hypothetical protein